MSAVFRVRIDEELREIIPDYLAARKHEVSLLQNYLQKKEYEKIRIIGHSLKGTGGGFGFWELTNIGAELEVAGKKAEEGKIVDLIEHLREFLDGVVVTYE